MRRPRALLQGQEAFYHCMSRTVGGEFLFTPREREEFRRRLRKQADFSQVTVKTDTCLSNHFHFVIEVPSKVELSDTKLFRVKGGNGGSSKQATIGVVIAGRTSDGRHPCLRPRQIVSPPGPRPDSGCP